jgi:hypothetical protein
MVYYFSGSNKGWIRVRLNLLFIQPAFTQSNIWPNYIKFSEKKDIVKIFISNL